MENGIQEISDEMTPSSINKDPNEMILHMKGPIYATAERNISSPEIYQGKLTKRAYLINGRSTQYFRRPQHDYKSLYTKHKF